MLKTADRWLDLTERTFNFAVHAREAFENGSVQDKKEILVALCSNPLMRNQELIAQAEKWFVRMQEGYKPLAAKYERLELGKKPLNTKQMAALADIRSQWWRWGESNSRPEKSTYMCLRCVGHLKI